MKIRGLIYKIKPPCQKCPYKLGQIKTVENPCPQCRLNGYQSYEWFQKLQWQGKKLKNGNE